jgi:hypothetical protein
LYANGTPECKEKSKSLAGGSTEVVLRTGTLALYNKMAALDSVTTKLWTEIEHIAITLP